MSIYEPALIHATLREVGEEFHIECRFADGQKFAAITVDAMFPELAQRVLQALVPDEPAPQLKAAK